MEINLSGTITIAVISALVGGLVGFLSNLKKLADMIANSIGKVTQKQIEPLEAKIDILANKIDEVDLNSVKDFLVGKFAEIERGEELDGVTRQRVYEEMERYTTKGGNSYIKARFDELKKQGRL